MSNPSSFDREMAIAAQQTSSQKWAVKSHIESALFEYLTPKRVQKIRDAQHWMTDRAMEMFLMGIDVVMIQAGTGAGKSNTADMIRQSLGHVMGLDDAYRMLYLPPHIQLQEQMLEQFPDSILLKGKSKYPHARDPQKKLFPRETCADCHCRFFCPPNGSNFKDPGGCVYRETKNNFETAKRGITNLSYFITAANYTGMFSPEQPEVTNIPIEDQNNFWIPMATLDHKDKEIMWARTDPSHFLRFLEDGPTCAHCGKHANRRWTIILYHPITKNTIQVGNDCAAEFPHYPLPKEGKKTLKDGWSGDYLTVIDEADCLENTILDFVSVEVDSFAFDKINRLTNEPVPPPPVYNQDQEWYAWSRVLLSKATEARERMGTPAPTDRHANRLANYLEGLKESLETAKESWVYQAKREYRKNKSGKNVKTGDVYEVTIRPVEVGELGKKYFWDHCGKTVAMSASIVSADMFAEETGLAQSGKRYDYIEVDSTWDRYRRPMLRVPGLNVVKRQKALRWKEQECWPNLLSKILFILFRHPQERCLIHTVSFEMAQDLHEAMDSIFPGRLILHKQSSKKAASDETDVSEEEISKDPKRDVLNALALISNGVVLSPSLERGVDLPDDMCRNVIWAKIPWPNLGDKVNSRRMDKPNGSLWYTIATIRTFLQGVGRGMRHEGDWCRNWTIDDQFDRIVSKKHLLPRWFVNTIRPPGDYLEPTKTPHVLTS